HVLDRSPAGSSSGSGVAVAAGLCAFAVGTETDGSIVSPSSYNGIVGFKPTLGLISQRGIIPIAHSQDTAGPMARCVADAALLLRGMTGEAFELEGAGLNGKRIGVLRKPFAGYSEHTDTVYEQALQALKEAGATLLDPVAIRTARELRRSRAEGVLMAHEFKHDLNAYLATRSGLPVKSLEDLIAFNREHADVELPYFRQELFERAQKTTSLDAAKYLEAKAKL